MAERMTIEIAKTMPQAGLEPCNSCDLKPKSCGNQRLVTTAGNGDMVLCTLGKGFVRRVEIPVSDILMVTDG